MRPVMDSESAWLIFISILIIVGVYGFAIIALWLVR
jgi:hypothetical protein